MAFETLLQKIAANKPLTSGELSELTNISKELDDVRAIVKKWERGIDNKVDPMSLDLPESGFKVVMTTTQTISDLTNTNIQFDTVVFDDDNGVNLSADNTKVGIVRPGTYLVGASVVWDSSSVGPHYSIVFLNDTYSLATHKISSTESFPLDHPVNLISLNEGDYLKLRVHHNSGASRNVIGNSVSYLGTSMWGFRVRIFKEDFV